MIPLISPPSKPRNGAAFFVRLKFTSFDLLPLLKRSVIKKYTVAFSQTNGAFWALLGCCALAETHNKAEIAKKKSCFFIKVLFLFLSDYRFHNRIRFQAGGFSCSI